MKRRALNWIVVAAVLAALATAAAAQTEPPLTPGSNGDAFVGLAQAPEATLFIGAATTGIPIVVPPGRKNLTPKLGLSYSSSGGPSPYGYGWDLPLGQIQRSTKHGVLSCSDLRYQNDFVLALPGGSVECTLDPNCSSEPNCNQHGDSSAWPCHPLVEESFLRIEYRPSSNTWEVFDKSGLHYLFGDSTGARTGSTVQSLFVSGSPCTYTFSWALTEIDDPNGNSLQVTYLQADGMLYPDHVLYGGHSANPVLAHPFEVDFVWRDLFQCPDGGSSSRPCLDRPVNGLGGFPAILTRLLHRVNVRSSGQLVRAYELMYEFETSTTVDDRIGRQSFLMAVTLYDGNNLALGRLDGLPASSTFSYHQNNTTAQFGFLDGPQRDNVAAAISGGGRVTQRGGPIPGIGSYRRTFRDIFDMNGDGIPDLVDIPDSCPTDSHWKVYLGSRKGFAQTAIDWLAVPSSTYGCGIRYVSVSNRNSQTWTDTLDINGDGIPDWVDGTSATCGSGQWAVYFGQRPAGAAGWGFSQAPTCWKAPAEYLRRSYLDGVNDPFNGNSGGTSDRYDVIDLNGDGLPDFADSWANKVWFNTGSGFEDDDGADFTFIANRLRFVATTGTELLGLYDINGDGLVDQIWSHENSWAVYLNAGHQFQAAAQTWTVPNLCGRKGTRDVYDHSTDQGDIGRDVLDINGDGLPDVVDVCGWTTNNPYWTVYLNWGSGFSPTPYSWRSPSPYIRNRINNTGTDVGFETVADTFDADGDGLVDFVDFKYPPCTSGCFFSIYHNAGGAWVPACTSGSCPNGPTDVATNPNGGHADLLEQMQNGIGGTTNLVYRPSTQWTNTFNGIPSMPFVTWTVTHIDQDDGLEAISLGSHTLTKDLTYSYGVYDPLAREFLGFGTVDQRDGDGHLRRTYFHQDMIRKGKVKDLELYDGTTVLMVKHLNTWTCADPSNGSTVTCPDPLAPTVPLWVRLSEADHYEYDFGVSTSKLSSDQNVSWDTFGNVTQNRKGGTGAIAVDTRASYTAQDGAGIYMVDKPTRTWVVIGNGKLEEKWFFYDNASWGGITKGNVTKVESWLDTSNVPLSHCTQSSTQNCVATTMGYDNYGNITSVTDANGNATTTTYDATQIYPVVVHNALGQEVTSVYDPGCGQLLEQTALYDSNVQNGGTAPRSRRAYDTFCRLTKTALPDETLDSPHVTYQYKLGAPGRPTDTRMLIVEPTAPGGQRYVDELTDALGRHRQTQRDGVVDGAAVSVIEGTATFDARGNVAARYGSFTLPQLPHQGPAWYVAPAENSATRFLYDPLNRMSQSTAPDGAVQLVDYTLAWQTTTWDPCAYAGSCPGSTAVAIRDAFGRTVEQQVWLGNTMETRTQSLYDGLGRLVMTRQGTGPSSSQWVDNTSIYIDYDSLGRKIRLDDPDSGPPTSAGTWTYGYDKVGNLVYEDDPVQNRHVQFSYDALNRVSQKCYFTSDGYSTTGCASVPDTIQYTYDGSDTALNCVPGTCTTGHCGVGRLTSVDDLGQNGTTLCYDVRGRQRRVQTSIDVASHTTAATTLTNYDVADHVSTITYPDSEVVTYAYDAAGQPQSLTGNAGTYVTDLTYDAFGRVRQLTHGNGVVDTHEYSDASQNYRLQRITTSASYGNVQDLLYDAYQKNGLLTHVTDAAFSGTLGNTAGFTYDGLGRLTGVTGNQFMNASYVYGDHLGNLTQKDGVTFTYGNTAKPHQLTNAIGGAITHDRNGNRMTKAGSASASGGQGYVYTGDDRVDTITANTGGTMDTIQYVYDYSGRRIGKNVDNGTTVTRYYNDLAEVTAGYLTKNYFVAGMRVASQRVTAPTALAALPPHPAVMLARVPTGHPALVLLLRPDVQKGLWVAAVMVGTGLWLAPWRRKRVIGVRVRHGQVIGVLVAFGVASLPVPILIRPAWAGGGGGGGGGGPGPTPAVGSNSLGVMHFHVDHLGSTQVITRGTDGSVFEYIRYKAYGEVRGHYGPDGTSTSGCGDDQYCREFTGYDTEPTSGLEDAGARVYDPALATFLTHDPAGQFANPYTYTNWDPVNATDPGGALSNGWAISVMQENGRQRIWIPHLR